jgi:sigma-B regulation protein RsbU (phosphoserine phosphatase)
MIESLIRRVPIFASLPQTEIVRLAQTLQLTSYPADSVLFYEGDFGDRFYIVLEGEIAIVKALGADAERLIGVRGAGTFVGEMSLLNPDGLRTASVKVQSDAQVLELTRADFDALVQRYPALVYDMLRIMSTRLRDSHEAAMRELQDKNRHLAQAYDDLQIAQAQIIEQETLARELRLAREIQESMLPRALPRPPGFEIGARMVPARMVGGDFFDLFPLDADTIGIVIGDVSGKGIPAALFMTLVCSLLRAEAARTVSPEEVLRSVNRQLSARNAKHIFVTVLYGRLHLPTRTLTFVRAGHEPPLLCDASGAALPVTFGRSQPLGLFPHPILDTRVLTLPPGATLLLYTDGVTDAADQQGELFGLERLEATLRSSLAAPAQTICDRLMEALTTYPGTASQADDITMVAVRAQLALEAES